MESFCEVCHEVQFKYKCPRCFKKTCSLPCSQKHKTQDACSGIAHDPTTYIASEALKEADDEKHESNLLVQRDYQFLNKLKRSLEVDMRDGRLINKKVLQPYGSYAKRQHYDQECQRVIRRGVNCILLPKGMQRSLMNKSKWDKPLDLFVWSIEWVLCPKKKKDKTTEEPFKHVSHRIKETDSLLEGMGKIICEKCYEFYNLAEEGEPLPETKAERTQRLINSGLKFYTKWFPYNVVRIMDSKKLIELDARHKSIAELFKNRTVIEFPTIFVAEYDEELPEAFTVVADDSTHSQRTANSNDSSNESQNNSDSDENSEPIEESSKPLTSSTAAESDGDSDGYDPGVTLDFLAG
ncbi:related to Box C/D snoRNA protein 1 [Zygosaccharomyces bailii ISA1307]|nr:related to Box C/D snoRNA protein 1 [Zygosaccharomyces bailii ISA1307]